MLSASTRSGRTLGRVLRQPAGPLTAEARTRLWHLAGWVFRALDRGSFAPADASLLFITEVLDSLAGAPAHVPSAVLPPVPEGATRLCPDALR